MGRPFNKDLAMSRVLDTLISQTRQQSGDIIPSDGVLTIRLDPLPTRRATKALTQLPEFQVW